MAQKPETVFRKNTVRPALLKLPNTVIFSIQQKAIRGDPDFILCINGVFVALELKSEGEKPSALQSYKLQSVERAHGVAISAMPSTWDAALNILKELSCNDTARVYNSSKH